MNGTAQTIWQRCGMLLDRLVRQRLAAELAPMSAEAFEMLFPQHFTTSRWESTATANASSVSVSLGGGAYSRLEGSG